MLRFNTTALVLFAWMLSSVQADADMIIVSDVFNGSSTSPLNGVSPDINNTNAGNNWVADGHFNADGSIRDDGNVDVSAYIDLGADFAFSANSLYKLSMEWSGLNNGIWFAGFVSTQPTTSARIQTQGTNFMIRARSNNLSNSGVFPFTYMANKETTYAAATNDAGNTGAAELLLTTNSLSDATFTVAGSADTAIPIDLTAQAYRYLSIGFEDAGLGAAATDDQLVSITFSSVPEPSCIALLGLASCGLLLRKRHKSMHRGCAGSTSAA